MEKLSFVIPCYNSAETVGNVVDEIHQVMLPYGEYEYEIIMVSDASPDNVFAVIERLAQDDTRITGVELAKNFGQHAALMAGYRICTGDIIISLDDDGQTPVDEVMALVDAIHEGSDVAFGRYDSIKQSKFRIFGTRVNDFMLEVLVGKPKNIEATSFYACKRFILDEILRYENAFPYITGLVFRATKNIVNVTVRHRERAAGKSAYSIRKLMGLWLNGATAFSVKPLRLATIIGVLCALSGFVLVVYTIIHKILNPDIPAGYSSTMSVLLFVGGMIMVMLGAMGEYVGRMYMIQNSSPQYVVRRTTTQNRK
jgi:undecaprenyl-phosphate 4-deoxy-4-formamido-L-arabinose transferase